VIWRREVPGVHEVQEVCEVLGVYDIRVVREVQEIFYFPTVAKCEEFTKLLEFKNSQFSEICEVSGVSVVLCAVDISMEII